MKNKNLIIGGIVVAGIVAYYFYNKNKGGGLASSSIVNSNIPKVESNSFIEREKQLGKNTTSTPDYDYAKAMKKAQDRDSRARTMPSNNVSYIPCKGQDGVVRNLLKLPIGTKCY